MDKKYCLKILPSELTEKTAQLSPQSSSWQAALSDWMDQQLAMGNSAILDTAMPEFEKIMLETGIIIYSGTQNKMQPKRLGWGRNTLTRKLKELDIN